MNPPVNITTSLCVSTPELETLLQGRSIAALSRSFITAVTQFALCPVDSADVAPIQAWAKLEFCRIYSSDDEIKKISALTGLEYAQLQTILQERYKIFLACLRVYRLPQPVRILAEQIDSNKLGSFIRLPNSLSCTTDIPVLEDAVFQQRQQQLIKLEAPKHADLKQLHDQILATFPTDRSGVSSLLQDLKGVLGWTHLGSAQSPDLDMSWIKTIKDAGNSSDGYTFEKLVRKSLIKLGFSNSRNDIKASLDPNSTGGAGGIDVFCEAPYFLVGECKASKNQTVPTTVCSQLTYLGQTHLRPGEYEQSIKVIFAAGVFAKPANNVANPNQMNVMRPETLQRLVELKAKHPGSINLLELKPCLESQPFGEDADKKVNDFIDHVWERLRVRAHLVNLIKQLNAEVNFDSIYGAYMFSRPPVVLDREIIKSILSELASPLTGYLGRRKARDGSDRFYFLRSLDVDPA